MIENIDVHDAIRHSIQMEKNAMNFYELAARQMKDPDAKRVFTLLASEEKSHAAHFYKIFTGTGMPSFEEIISAPPDHESTWLSELAKTSPEEFNEQKAMELAMDKEANLEKALRDTAAQISDPEVRAIFELNAQETHNHYELIEAEYSRIMAMVHESDMKDYVRE